MRAFLPRLNLSTLYAPGAVNDIMWHTLRVAAMVDAPLAPDARTARP